MDAAELQLIANALMQGADGCQIFLESEDIGEVRALACDLALRMRMPLFVLDGRDYEDHGSILPKRAQASPIPEAPVILLVERLGAVPEAWQLQYIHLVDGGGSPDRRLASGSVLLLQAKPESQGQVEPLLLDRGRWYRLSGDSLAR